MSAAVPPPRSRNHMSPAPACPWPLHGKHPTQEGLWSALPWELRVDSYDQGKPWHFHPLACIEDVANQDKPWQHGLHLGEELVT